MAETSIRVRVVDDSAVIREMICDYVGAAPGMEVVGTASNGREAVEKHGHLRPDVVTLDVRMPKMDGLETLDALLAQHPTPVIMVSALTQLGASITLDALDRGALDYVAKPESGRGAEAALREELIRKIRSVVGTDVHRILDIRKARKQRRAEQATKKRSPKEVSDASPLEYAERCVAIGISTGGPPALSRLFEGLKPPMPPIVVVQHMPTHFTKPLAWRLDSLARLSIKEAASGDILRPNHVVIAPGGKHLSLQRRGKMARVAIEDGEPVSGHKPSVDVMMRSAAAIYGPGCLGVIMTGMGKDGAEGCRAIRSAGGYVLGQDEASSDVYGMNKVAFQAGNVDRQFSLHEAADAITRQVRRLSSRSPVGA